MRIISKQRLEEVLRGDSLPVQRVRLLFTSYYLVYGNSCQEFYEAEIRQRAHKQSMDYFYLCRQAAMNHPSKYAEFARTR